MSPTSVQLSLSQFIPSISLMAQGKGLRNQERTATKGQKVSRAFNNFTGPKEQNLVVGSCHNTQDLRSQDSIMKGDTEEQSQQHYVLIFLLRHLLILKLYRARS